MAKRPRSAGPFYGQMRELGEEGRGILLGPIAVGGMIYDVCEGLRTEDYERAE